jgi:mutator protein MutT
MKKATISFCIKDDQVLLGMKKVRFGAGKWNGYGGKVEVGETPQQAASRELKEESNIESDPNNFEQVALIQFYFAGVPKFECYVFITRSWTGEAVESEEMSPKWFPLTNIPYSDMWVADAKWIPLILAGEKIEARVDFNEEGSEVNDFSYKPAQF